MTLTEQNKRLHVALAVLAALVSDLPVPPLPIEDDEMWPWALVASAVREARDLLNDIALERAS